MAIYPIISGQKWDPKHIIPPRTPSASTSEPVQPSSGSGDLIDFGNDEALLSAKTEAKLSETEVKPPLDSSHKSTAEIQKLLASTGAPAVGGPLIDFHKDMGKDLPTAGLKRTETEDSGDEFHDARG